MYFRKNVLISLVAIVAAALGTVAADASNIPMRGFKNDLSSTADQFLSIDLNGDGRTDMLYFRPGGGFAGAYLSHGDGTFRYVPYTSGGNHSNGFPGDLSTPSDTFVVLDLNGDGKQDFIQYRPGLGYTIRCLSQGDGTVSCDLLSTPGQLNSNFHDDMMNSNTHIIAMPRRGTSSEFLVYAPGGGANIYSQQPNSTTLQYTPLTQSQAQNLGNLLASSPQIDIISLDANGDGSPDLFVHATSNPGVSGGVALMYINNGNNAFSQTTLSSGGQGANGFTGNPQNSNAHAIALDIDGDGKQDLLWWEAGSHVVTGFLSAGNGSVQAVNYEGNGNKGFGFQDDAGSPADRAVAINLNGDAKQDFIWYSPGNHILTTYVSLTGINGNKRGYVQGSFLEGQNQGGAEYGPAFSQDVILPVNFLGQSASGFISYVPGSGSNGGSPFFMAYTPRNEDPTSSIFGALNTYQFYTFPGSFLGDLNWSLGNVPTKEVVMPGTHDSNMYNLNSGSLGLSETQWGDYIHQLEYGARYFDFRVAYTDPVASGAQARNLNGAVWSFDTGTTNSSGFLLFGHGSVLTNRFAQDVINSIEEWLNNNPKEVVVLDLNNAILSGSQGDKISAFASMLASTEFPNLIYTPMQACGSKKCSNPNLMPQNMSINNLGAKGGRLILVNTPSELQQLGWSWGSVDPQIGYCGNSGNSTPGNEMQCINTGDSGSGTPSLPSLRPPFRAADAANNYTHVVAALTPDGNGGVGFGPLILADDSNIGFNVGSNQYDLNQQLMNGAWNNIALNMFTIDGLGGSTSYGGTDNVAQLMIQRNNQNWLDQHFFNNNLSNPAGAISIGANGDIWASGTGHSLTIFKYNLASATWAPLINGVSNIKKLAADPQGGVYVVQGTSASSPFGNLVHYDRNGQYLAGYSERVQDVAVAPDGSIWVSVSGQVMEFLPGNGVMQSSANHPGIHVAVDNMGRPWVTQATGEIFHYNGSTWVQAGANYGARASEIVSSVEGSVFVIGFSSPSVYRYNSQTDNFDPYIMDAAHIAVDPGGQPWAIRAGVGLVYKGSLDQM